MLARLLRSLRSPQPRRAQAPCVFIADVDKARQISPATELPSALAALRLRTLVAARRMAQSGPVWLVPPNLAAPPEALAPLEEAQAVVIGKFLTGRVLDNQEIFSRLMQWLKAGPHAPLLVADMTDDFEALPTLRSADTSFLHEWQTALLQTCHVTAACNALRDALAARAAHGISVIEDPYEAAQISPWRAPGGSPIRICWFGNTSPATLPTLARALEETLARFPDAAFSIELVTAVRWNEIRALVQRLAAARPGLEFLLTEWSLATTWQALERCDFVLLPHEWRDDWVKVKSHNRLVAAIAAGRFALASPIPSYLELKDYAWVDDDLAGGIAWAVLNPGAARERVVRGQAHVERLYAPAVLAEKWARVLGATAPMPPGFA